MSALSETRTHFGSVNVDFGDFFALITRLPLTLGAISINSSSLDAQPALDKSFSLTE